MVLKNVTLNGNVTDITVENGKITSVQKNGSDGVDFCGCCVIPGFIDIHTHGCAGYDTMDGKLEAMCAYLAKNGTTSWYPTTMTAPYEKIKAAVEAKTDYPGAMVMGFHMEGPYICEKYKGAQNRDYIKNPDFDEYSSLENMKLVTIAPELPGAMDFIEKCSDVVCLGHSSADYKVAAEAARCGAKCLTHTFNAMPPFHHRDPSLIGAAITEDMYVQVICDGLHLHRAAVIALYRIFGRERMILISDSMRATGLSDGEYEFGGQRITVKDAVARTEDGAIAGSTSTLRRCVQKAVEFGISFDDAVYMASAAPSRLMGINKGVVAVGYDADLLITDKKLNIIKTIINGEFFD